MLSLVAAALLSAAPALEAPRAVRETVVGAKKKKKKKSGGTAKPAEKDDDEETSEGLDLTQPETPPPAESQPGSSNGGSPSGEPVAPNEEPDPKPATSGWSLVTPRTVGEGANVIEGGVGWPGVYAGFWRGILTNLDVGAKVGFNWGYEGLLTRPLPGLRIQLAAKYLITELAGLPLGVSFQPGFLLYFFPGRAVPGLLLPLSASLGLPNFVNKLNLSVTLEVPFFVIFGVGGVVPVVAGANAEYFITDSLLAFVRLKPLGVAVWTNGAGAFYFFEALAGVGFHL